MSKRASNQQCPLCGAFLEYLAVECARCGVGFDHGGGCDCFRCAAEREEKETQE